MGNERVVGVDGVGRFEVGDAGREAEDLVHQHKEWIVWRLLTRLDGKMKLPVTVLGVRQHQRGSCISLIPTCLRSVLMKTTNDA